MQEAESFLYPPIEPFKTGTLEVGVHTIYWEACGTPSGKPVVILHGGPGAGCSPKQRRFHDPDKHCIVLFDQRGCGRSTPDGCLEGNTTWELVADIERLVPPARSDPARPWGSRLPAALVALSAALCLRAACVCLAQRQLFGFDTWQVFGGSWGST